MLKSRIRNYALAAREIIEVLINRLEDRGDSAYIKIEDSKLKAQLRVAKSREDNIKRDIETNKKEIIEMLKEEIKELKRERTFGNSWKLTKEDSAESENKKREERRESQPKTERNRIRRKNYGVT